MAANTSPESGRDTSTVAPGELATGEGSLSIGELAKRTGVSTRTIRYYEELGILPPPERTTGGTRRYPKEFVFYLDGARNLKELGFGLDEIAELGKFALTGTWDSERSRKILVNKLAELEHRIKVLNRLHGLVVEASASGKSPANPVPALLMWVGEGSHDIDEQPTRQEANA